MSFSDMFARCYVVVVILFGLMVPVLAATVDIVNPFEKSPSEELVCEMMSVS